MNEKFIDPKVFVTNPKSTVTFTYPQKVSSLVLEGFSTHVESQGVSWQNAYEVKKLDVTLTATEARAAKSGSEHTLLAAPGADKVYRILAGYVYYSGGASALFTDVSNFHVGLDIAGLTSQPSRIWWNNGAIFKGTTAGYIELRQPSEFLTTNINTAIKMVNDNTGGSGTGTIRIVVLYRLVDITALF